MRLPMAATQGCIEWQPIRDMAVCLTTGVVCRLRVCGRGAPGMHGTFKFKAIGNSKKQCEAHGRV